LIISKFRFSVYPIVQPFRYFHHSQYVALIAHPIKKIIKFLFPVDDFHFKPQLSINLFRCPHHYLAFINWTEEATTKRNLVFTLPVIMGA
jgi:hypothetical protein